MSILNLQASLFAFENPLRLFEGWIHRFRYSRLVQINQKPVELRWTERAQRELAASRGALIIELQLYFSCMVKKRVLFHRQVDFPTVIVNERLQLAFRPVTAAACDPLEFVRDYPQGRHLEHGIAGTMIPRSVEIDFRRGDWVGNFSY